MIPKSINTNLFSQTSLLKVILSKFYILIEYILKIHIDYIQMMMDSDQESTSSSSTSSSSSLPNNIIHLNQDTYKTIKVSIFLLSVISEFFFQIFTFIYSLQKEVFIWVDSELKDTYEIDSERTWLEQKEDIITKLIPPLYKLVNRKYNVTNGKLLIKHALRTLAIPTPRKKYRNSRWGKSEE